MNYKILFFTFLSLFSLPVISSGLDEAYNAFLKQCEERNTAPMSQDLYDYAMTIARGVRAKDKNGKEYDPLTHLLGNWATASSQDYPIERFNQIMNNSGQYFRALFQQTCKGKNPKKRVVKKQISSQERLANLLKRLTDRREEDS